MWGAPISNPSRSVSQAFLHAGARDAFNGKPRTAPQHISVPFHLQGSPRFDFSAHHFLFSSFFFHSLLWFISTEFLFHYFFIILQRLPHFQQQPIPRRMNSQKCVKVVWQLTRTETHLQRQVLHFGDSEDFWCDRILFKDNDSDNCDGGTYYSGAIPPKQPISEIRTREIAFSRELCFLR